MANHQNFAIENNGPGITRMKLTGWRFEADDTTAIALSDSLLIWPDKYAFGPMTRTAIIFPCRGLERRASGGGPREASPSNYSDLNGDGVWVDHRPRWFGAPLQQG
jgi:hypothetical protein